jgi:hypothetical protein
MTFSCDSPEHNATDRGWFAAVADSNRLTLDDRAARAGETALVHVPAQQGHVLHAGAEHDDGEDLRKLPLARRKERLKAMLSRKGPHTQHIKYVEHLSEPGDAVLKSACHLNLEGIISKRASAPYVSDRTETWHKAKCRGGQEVVIGGWSGSANNLRSLLVGVYRSNRLVHTGRVGTGFNQRNAGGLLKKLKALKTDQSPFGGKDAPRRKADWHWVKLKPPGADEFIDRRREGPFGIAVVGPRPTLGEHPQPDGSVACCRPSEGC